MEYRNFRKITGTKLYRGSKPDILSHEQLKKLEHLGIKNIIDLRSPLEISGTAVGLLVDHKYKPFVLSEQKQQQQQQPEFREMKSKHNVEYKHLGEYSVLKWKLLTSAGNFWKLSHFLLNHEKCVKRRAHFWPGFRQRHSIY